MYNNNKIYNFFQFSFIAFLLINSLFSQASLAIITKSNGEVQYKHYMKTEFDNILNAGTELFNNDLLKTGNDGFIKFSYLDDGTTIKIHHDSELYIRGQVNNKNINKRINMSSGLLKLDVSKQNEDEFVVITPTSVASVKGTSFILESKEDGDKFYGYEGIVEVLNKVSNQVVKLSKNLKVTSRSGGEINSEIITQNDSEILNSFNLLDQDIEIEESEEEDGTGETDSESTNELKIKVYTSTGEEKIIIIKYNE